MSPTPDTRLTWAAFFVAIIAVLACGIWLVSSRQLWISETIPSESNVQEIIARATEIAGNEFRGIPTDVRASKTTLGKLNVVSCNPSSAWVSSLVAHLQSELDWCNPNTPAWVVELDGTFHKGGIVTHSIEVVLDNQGKFIRLGSPLGFRPEPD